MTRLARDMMKTGRKIGWSKTKRSIAYGEIWFEGPSRGLRVMFRAEDGKTDAHEVCKPGECEEALDEKLVTEVPKVASKLEAGAYQALSGNGWAEGQTELTLMAAELKLSYVKGKLGIVGEKSTKALGSGPAKSFPVAVFIAKDDKVLIVDFQLEDAKPGAGPTVAHELKMFKLP